MHIFCETSDETTEASVGGEYTSGICDLTADSKLSEAHSTSVSFRSRVCVDMQRRSFLEQPWLSVPRFLVTSPPDCPLFSHSPFRNDALEDGLFTGRQHSQPPVSPNKNNFEDKEKSKNAWTDEGKPWTTASRWLVLRRRMFHLFPSECLESEPAKPSIWGPIGSPRIEDGQLTSHELVNIPPPKPSTKSAKYDVPEDPSYPEVPRQVIVGNTLWAEQRWSESRQRHVNGPLRQTTYYSPFERNAWILVTDTLPEVSRWHFSEAFREGRKR